MSNVLKNHYTAYSYRHGTLTQNERQLCINDRTITQQRDLQSHVICLKDKQTKIFL